MNQLDIVSELIEDSRRKFEDHARRQANSIELEDILKKINELTSNCSERYGSGWFIFRTGQYEIMVSPDKICLLGHQGIINMEFRGDEILDYYDKLLTEYTKKQEKEVPF